MRVARRVVATLVRVDPEAYRSDAALAKWVQIGHQVRMAASRKKVL
jgi:methyl coenzyme M reductase gamma subunit